MLMSELLAGLRHMLQQLCPFLLHALHLSLQLLELFF
jgi:hypothetical protein